MYGADTREVGTKTSSASRRATVLLSGGIDSAACAIHLRSQGLRVEGLNIDYGQSAATVESAAAKTLGLHLNIQTHLTRFTGLAEHASGELIGRNAFLIFSALLFTKGATGLLGIGLHSGTPYPDCSKSFVESISKIIEALTDGRVSVVAPFISWNKKDIVDYAIAKGIPLKATYSCETGTVPPCGECLSCRDRKALGC